ncbi:TonB-dependent receptor [Altererythrobacter endophyticus]|uniref:TonB-dependent receptor n=2 Tax=Altericroceibacterium endophyticum TaxID=1808508 RepID=A0A6I4T2V0_9SPHN|nr:TonB-dependent receptor [Altericroceibacterium endophyticum]
MDMQHDYAWIRGSTSAFALIVSAMAPAAMAQETDDLAADEVYSPGAQQIVVTAQFREQDLQDTPLAITAVTGDMLAARGQVSVEDVGAQAPNVTLRQSPATYGPAMVAYIRGVGQRDSSFALEPGVGVYVDDVYLSTVHGSMLGLLDLERVEILRGPQGTLAGMNSIGGAIKLYSKKPDGQGGGFAELTYGSYDRLEVKAAADFALTDKLFARISGASVKRDGFVTRYDYGCTHPDSGIPSVTTNTEDCKLGTEGGRDYTAGRLAVRWEPSDRVSLDIVGDITRDDSEVGASTLLYVGQAAPPGQQVTGTSDQAAYFLNGVPLGTASGSQFITYSPYGNFALDGFSDSPYVSYETYIDLDPRDGSAPWQAPLKSAVNNWGLSASLNVELSDNLALTSITAYRDYDGVFSSADGTPLTPGQVANDIFNHQFSQEVRLSGQFADIVNVTVGGMYLHKRSQNISRVTLATLNFMENNVIPSTTWAAFANADLALTDRLTVGGGIRYTDMKKTFKYGRGGIPGSDLDGAPPPQIAGLDGVESTFKGDNVDFRGVVQYRWTDNLMTYGQISTGFKGGGANQRPFTPSQAIPHQPETLTAYEVGFKSELFDRMMRLNVSGFINKYDDILVSVTTCPEGVIPRNPCALPINAGKATVKGFEVETTIEPVEGLLIDASLAYLDFKYTQMSELAVASGVGLEDEGQYAMPWQWSIGAQYQIDLGSVGTLTPRVDVNFDDSFNRNANNVDAATGGKDIFGQIDSRTLLNARLTYETVDGDWMLALEAKNLTDKLYYTDVFDNRGSTSVVQGSPGQPRTFAVSIKRRF